LAFGGVAACGVIEAGAKFVRCGVTTRAIGAEIDRGVDGTGLMSEGHATSGEPSLPGSLCIASTKLDTSSGSSEASTTIQIH
jgi:hypothetical protein